MSVRISSTASAMLSSGDVKTYTECRLYNQQDNYLMNPSVVNASWNQSRNFGVSVLNLTILNSGGIHNIGSQFEIKKDYIIVLIEGYNTGNVIDQLPKFKGYIKDISYNTSSDLSTITLTVYDELIITQRSDIDKKFTANTILVTNEVLTPYIDAGISQILMTSNKVARISRSIDNIKLDDLIHGKVFYISSTKYIIQNINIEANTKSINGIFLSGTITGSLVKGDVIQNETGTYFGSILSGVTGTYYTGESYVKVSGAGSYSHGDRFYKVGNTAINFIGQCFYEVQVVVMNNTSLTIGGNGITTGAIIHDGTISVFRASHANWADYKTHQIQIRTYGSYYETNDNTFSGYVVDHEKGIIRLNDPVIIDNKEVVATYNYVPVGLYIEDVLRDLLVTKDQLSINLVKNTNFTQGLQYWGTMASGATTSNFITSVNNGIDIITKNTLTANQFIGLSQSNITLLSGFTYTVSVNVKANITLSGSFYIKLGTDASGKYSTSYLSIGQYMNTMTYTYTPNHTYTTKLLIYLSGCKTNDTWHLNDIQITYNPSKVNCLTTNHLYTTVSVEDGSASSYNLYHNLNYTTLPRYTILNSKLNNTSKSITVTTTSGLPSNGYILVDSEYLKYTGTTSTTITGISRGQLSSIQTDHEVGVRVWQIVSASKVWYMEYSNIIPKTYNSTASTYSVNGVNVGSAGSFTIRKSNVSHNPTFKEFFYRDGIVVLSGVGTASSVSLTTNQNYYFCQLQATDIETNKILIDYKNVNTRYDAITEIRSLIAPNYCINTVVRKNGSIYQTYIKGRYLEQKSIQDYNLNFISNIEYQSPTNSYNRVKMFGKLANPKNIMYNDDVTVNSVNTLDAQYIKQVPYTYSGGDGTWDLFTNQLSTKLTEGRFNKYFLKNVNLYGNAGILNYSYNFVVSKGDMSSTYGMSKLKSYNVNGVDVGFQSLIAGIYLQYIYYRSGNNEHTNAVLSLYNIYFTEKISGNDIIIGETLNSGKVVNIINLDLNSIYSKVIYVKHLQGQSIFTEGQVITSNLGNTVKVHRPVIEGFVNQYNYSNIGAISTYLLGFYDVTFNILNSSITNILPPTIVPDSYTMYINGYEYNKDHVTWVTSGPIQLGDLDNYKTDEFFRIEYFGKVFDFYYRRGFSKMPIYINSDINEYNLHPYVNPGEVIPRGCVRLEKDSGNGPVELLTLNYNNQPGYTNVTNGDYGNIFTQFKNGNYLAFKKRHADDINNLNQPDKSIKDATHIRYFTKVSPLNWSFDQNNIKISHNDLLDLGLDPTTLVMKLDGYFLTRIPNEFITTDSIPLITRIRDFTGKGRNQQIGIVSLNPIGENPLMVVDLGSVKSLSYIDIQAGLLYKPSTYSGEIAYDTKFKIKLQYCDIDKNFTDLTETDFISISDDTDAIDISGGDVVSLDSSKLGERFSTRFLKFSITATDKAIESGTDKVPVDWYGGSIAGLAIYESDIIVSEKYTNSGIINMYKDMNVYEQLYTQELLDTQTQYKLDEYQKDNTKVTVNSPWFPHIETGMTLNLNDQVNSVNRNYFVETISHGDSGTSIGLAYYA